MSYEIYAGFNNISPEDYYQDPVKQRYGKDSLTASTIKCLLATSPAHALANRIKDQHDDKKAFNIGRAAHMLMLGDEERFGIWQGDTWLTTESREFKRQCYDDGLVPLLADQYNSLVEMVEAGRKQLANHEAAGAFDNGEPEQTMIWQDEAGMWCRGLLDWLPDEIYEGMALNDYKTTARSAHPSRWASRTLWQIGAHIQAKHYLDGFKALTGLRDVKFRFVVQEQAPPYALSVVEVSPAGLVHAERQIARAKQIWTSCQAEQDWPAYDRRVIYADPPPYQLEEWAIEEAQEVQVPAQVPW